MTSTSPPRRAWQRSSIPRARRRTTGRRIPRGETRPSRWSPKIRRGVAEALGVPVEPDAPKTILLRKLLEGRGPAAVVELGLQVRPLFDHPVLAVLVADGSGRDVLDRWFRLERFGHTRNRTRVVEAQERSVLLEHYALDGGAVDPVDDLFIWGLLLALFDRAGFTGVQAEARQPSGGSVVLYDEADVRLSTVPPSTELVQLSWAARRPGAGAPELPTLTDDTFESVLARVFERDLLRTWRVRDCATVLGLSSRQLQRRLRGAGTTFCQTLQRTRLEAARELMSGGQLNLTEIAFCTGFSDLAHFSRLFRRHLDLPPSALHGLLAAQTRR